MLARILGLDQLIPSTIVDAEGLGADFSAGPTAEASGAAGAARQGQRIAGILRPHARGGLGGRSSSPTTRS